eukprot:scaffold15228_cov118-Isochrysis_galbana.AAC.1
MILPALARRTGAGPELADHLPPRRAAHPAAPRAPAAPAAAGAAATTPAHSCGRQRAGSAGEAARALHHAACHSGCATQAHAQARHAGRSRQGRGLKRGTVHRGGGHAGKCSAGACSGARGWRGLRRRSAVHEAECRRGTGRAAPARVLMEYRRGAWPQLHQPRTVSRHAPPLPTAEPGTPSLPIRAWLGDMHAPQP